MRLAIVQMNPQLGSIEKNSEQIEKAMRAARERDAIDLFITPEQALIGYPAGDLLSFPSYLEREAAAVGRLTELTRELDCGLLLGHCERRRGFVGKPLYNAVSLCAEGELKGRVRKTRLPSYDVFEDERFFESCAGPQTPLEWRGLKIAISICEDGWDNIRAFGVRDVRAYPKRELPTGCNLLVNCSASPFSKGKRLQREDLFSALAQREQMPLLYSNTWGAQDEVLFDGGSFGVNALGEIAGHAALFAPDVLVFEFSPSTGALSAVNPSQRAARPVDEWGELRLAAVTGLRDFITKCGGRKVLLGLSGGIDSALVAALATEALGREKVLGVGMPSSFSSEMTRELSRESAKRLQIEFREIPIGAAFRQLKSDAGLPDAGLATENMQARIRGLLLMGLANHEGRFLLATGNKSELAMGYATLYGDMNGALAPIGDFYKTEVYGLSHLLCIEALREGRVPPIPPEVLNRAPTAELAPNQRDCDSLPPYEVLDSVVHDIIENQGEPLLKEAGWDKLLEPRFTFRKVRRQVMSQEFKRYQSAPLLRVHGRAFGSAWRFPLTKDNQP